MKAILYLTFFLLIGLNLFFASWYVLHKDINFGSDIARDFLLYQEISQKKIVLIGPKSSVSGLFHGPVWLYLNYPAFVLGKGNPVAVGWNWVFLIGCFLALSFIVAKKLFDTQTAILYVLMNSLYMSFHAKGLINPHGALFLLPLFFFFFVRYIQTQKLRFLIAHIITAGFIIQFEMAIGIPLIVLSFLFVTIASIRSVVAKNDSKKRLTLLFHPFMYLFVIITLANYIIFDLRHQFILFHSVLRYLSPQSGNHSISYLALAYDRFKLMMTGVELLRVDPGYRNAFLFVIVLFFIGLQLKDKKYRLIYLSFLYFYVGFFVLSLINRGPILYFYFYPFFPFVFLIFCSFVTSRFKKVFLVFFFLLYILNTMSAINETQLSKAIIGKDIDSWQFLYKVAQKVYTSNDKSFGYFVYSPDVIAYGEKYAMSYAGKQYKSIDAHYFKKKPVTYLVVAPPPPDNPFMKDDWWRINLVKINDKPQSEVHFPNGYKIQRFLLTDEQTKIPFDPGIDPGLSFR